MAARRRAEDQAHQKCGREADHSESAKQRMSSHAERPRVLCRLCSAGSKTPDEADNAAPQRRPLDRVVTRFLTPFVPGSIGGGAKSAAASMPGIGKPPSVLIETCLHLPTAEVAPSVGRGNQSRLPAFVHAGLWAV
jgi:hypothetical protein